MLTVGNSLGDNGQKDGHVSSVLLGTSFTAILFAFFREYINPTLWYSRNQYPIVLIIIFVLSVISIFSWVTLCVLAKYQRKMYLGDQRNDPVSKLVHIFYGIFGVVTMIDQFLCIIVDINCYRQNEIELPANKLKRNYFYLISVIGRFIEIVFFLVQMVSVRCLSAFQLRRSLLVHYFLSVILLTNVASYLFNAFKLMYDMFQSEKHFENRSINSNVTTRTCYWTSTLTQFLQPLNGIIIPMQQEYYILSICFIVSMFPRMSNVERDDLEITVEENFYRSLPDETGKQTIQFRNRRLDILVSSLAVAMFIPGIVVLLVRQKSSDDRKNLFVAWQWCLIFPNIVLVMVILAAFYVLRKVDAVEFMKERNRGYLMNNDTFYIVSSVGVFFFNSFGLVYSLAMNEPGVSTARFVLLMIQVLYQTIFIISLKTKGLRGVKRIQRVLLFLLFPNFLYWVFDEFFTLFPHFDDSYEKAVGPTWPSVRETILPLARFYRFQSFVFLYRLWKFGNVTLR